MSSYILHRFCLSHVLLSFCLLLLSVVEFNLMAQQSVPKSVKIYPELEGHWFLDGRLKFGCEITYSNGGKRRTPGYLNGNFPWRELVCESEQGTIHGDEVLVDLFKVNRNNNTLRIQVHLRGNSSVKSVFEIHVPPLQSIAIFLPEKEKPLYGETIEPYVELVWANGAGYTYQFSDEQSVIPADSVQLFFNDKRIYGGKVTLPEFQLTEPHQFSLSAIWTSKPWIHAVEVYPYIGREHAVWKFHAAKGRDGGVQSAAPAGMDGAEGFGGMRGADAAEVKVSVKWNDTHTALFVEATNGLQSYHDTFSPESFSLEIIARGGNGGDGGRGGEGGRSPFDDAYRAGIGGKGGRAGRGGKGASVLIETAPDTEAFIPCIIIDAADGESGQPGRGGRGGVYSNGYGVPTLLELIFPSRNYDGEPGEE